MTTGVTATYRVIGMTCEHCVAAVRAEVGSIAGVRRVDIDLAAGTVAIASDGPVPIGALAAAVDEAGYDLADAQPAASQ